jgi:DNA-binding LacI/PurR family transcriptional regulator
VSEHILQRVKEAVEKTGYVPNMLAGGLASRKSRLVAAVIPTISGNIFGSGAVADGDAGQLRLSTDARPVRL